MFRESAREARRERGGPIHLRLSCARAPDDGPTIAFGITLLLIGRRRVRIGRPKACRRVHTPLLRVLWRGVGQPGIQQTAFGGLLHTRWGYWGGGRLWCIRVHTPLFIVYNFSI